MWEEFLIRAREMRPTEEQFFVRRNAAPYFQERANGILHVVTGILSLVGELDVIVVSQSALANSMLLVISVIFVGNALADSTTDIEKFEGFGITAVIQF